MLWFAIALLGYFFLALVFILDKLILTKSVNKPVVYTFYSTIFLFGALLAWPLGVEWLVGIDWLWAIASGVAFGLGLWSIFVALKKGEATHIHPFSGAVITMITYVLSSSLLDERLNSGQLVGIGILASASFLLSFEKSRSYTGFHIGFVWAIISGMFFAISHVSAKYLYELYPFLTGFVWTRATTGLVGLFVLVFPSVRSALKKKKKAPKTFAKKHALGIVVIDKVLGVLAVVCIQYAAAIGSVSLVFALSGFQYALMFLLVFFLTTCFPKVFKEYFTKQELFTQTLAIVLVVIGSALLVL